MVKSKVKYIQSLSQKKQRDQDGVFLAEGPKIINELLSAPGIELLELYAVKDWLETRKGIDHSKTTEIDEGTLEKISLLTTPNQVIGIFRKPSAITEPVLKDKITLMADNIQDPGNMGSIIRCADWFGVLQVICSYDCADVFSPKAVQSTMGSVARVNTIYADLPTVIEKNPDIVTYAATLGGMSLYKTAPIKEGIILIGNESKGISKNLLALCRQQITIPKTGAAESLNAAVAAGIILSHLLKTSP